jgi:hypothetical protein
MLPVFLTLVDWLEADVHSKCGIMGTDYNGGKRVVMFFSLDILILSNL